MKRTEWNPHEYNLRQIDERLWKWKATIVLRTKFSEQYDLKRLNKDALKFIHQTGSNLYSEFAVGYEKNFLGVCTGEIQEQSGLLHHHAILGELWKPKMWFNNSKSELMRRESLDFRLKAGEHLSKQAERFKKALESRDLSSTYLPTDMVEVVSADVGVYIPENMCGKEWIGYIVKFDSGAYWSPAYHNLVKQINEAQQTSEMIPEHLRHLRCWNRKKETDDFQARLQGFAEQKGGDINAQPLQ